MSVFSIATGFVRPGHKYMYICTHVYVHNQQANRQVSIIYNRKLLNDHLHICIMSWLLHA